MPALIEIGLSEEHRRAVAEAVEHVAAAVRALREGTPEQQQAATAFVFAVPSGRLRPFGVVRGGRKRAGP